jgi:hypothetical protein
MAGKLMSGPGWDGQPGAMEYAEITEEGGKALEDFIPDTRVGMRCCILNNIGRWAMNLATSQQCADDNLVANHTGANKLVDAMHRYPTILGFNIIRTMRY